MTLLPCTKQLHLLLTAAQLEPQHWSELGVTREILPATGLFSPAIKFKQATWTGAYALHISGLTSLCSMLAKLMMSSCHAHAKHAAYAVRTLAENPSREVDLNGICLQNLNAALMA